MPDERIGRVAEGLPELKEQAICGISDAIGAIERWEDADRERFVRWFGDEAPDARERVREVLKRVAAAVADMTLHEFEPGKVGKPHKTYAYTYAGARRDIYVGELFWRRGPTPPNCQPGILVHEASHWSDTGPPPSGSEDVTYGVPQCEALARDDPPATLQCADSYEYFVEESWLPRAEWKLEGAEAR